MPCRAFEDQLELETAVIEPVPFGEDPATMACYPLPLLRATGGTVRTKVPVVVLENGQVRARVAPSLGGRVLGEGRVSPGVGGRRGMVLSQGVQVSLDPDLDSMSRFDHLVHSSLETASVLLFSQLAGTPLALQVCWTLTSESDELLCEARVFNRSLRGAAFRLVCDADGERSEVVARGWLAPRDTRAFQLRVSAGRVVAGAVGLVDDAMGEADGPPESLPLHLRGAAHVVAAGEAARHGEYRAALASMDSALATLSDDPLAWWQRAVLARLCGEAGERDDLTAAHAISPLEPALRAEAFLSIPQQHGREGNPVTAPLAQDPDAMCECVQLLVEAGLLQEAARLTDEAHRHRETPLLRYVHAWSLLRATRMEVEAAGEVARASKAPLEPPFPWRTGEVEAVLGLSERFPSDGRLQSLKSLLLKRSGPAT